MDTTPKSQKILNSLECCKLDILLKMKLKVSEILKLLCRHISTIYQEINQGTVKFRKSNLSVRKEYSAYYSLNIRQGLMSKTGRKLRYIELCPKLLSYIQSKLDEKYSPDAISGELNKEYIYTVCSQTIYNYISLCILNSRTYRKCTSKAKNNGIYSGEIFCSGMMR